MNEVNSQNSCFEPWLEVGHECPWREARRSQGCGTQCILCWVGECMYSLGQGVCLTADSCWEYFMRNRKVGVQYEISVVIFKHVCSHLTELDTGLHLAEKTHIITKCELWFYIHLKKVSPSAWAHLRFTQSQTSGRRTALAHLWGHSPCAPAFTQS